MKKILYINDNDLAGSRFNGHDLQIMLNKTKQFRAKQYVMEKRGTSKNTTRIIEGEGGTLIREKCKELEGKMSLLSVIYPFGELLKKNKDFLEADIVHYHLIFNYYMSIFSFQDLSQIKPTIWTLHDPWALTGHCVYPVECNGWMTGCTNCPNLSRQVPLKVDNSRALWKIKESVYKNIDIDIVVASKWMYEMVSKSPFSKYFKRVHLIPFGIDLQLFKRRSSRSKLRRNLDINKEDFVIMFRQDPKEWKGLPYIIEMFAGLDNKDHNIIILTVGDTGHINHLKERYRVIEYPWVNDNHLMVDLYSTADLFLMPSVAEAFGLMAIEAMACSLPVIVFDGTSLPDVTFSPECGINLKKGDTKGFINTVNRLLLNREECFKRGELGRILAEKNYDVEKYHERMIKLYNNVGRRVKK